ncbi:MAG: amidohydrolase family protein [Steroidobacteraceae bacterium]
MPDMTVIISGGRIAALGKTPQLHAPNDAQVVDAKGKFLIPGLWDMHVHIGVTGLSYAPYFPLFIANGITGVRDMGGILHLGQFMVWRQAIEQGRLLGPRLVMAGAIVDGPRPVRPYLSIAVDSAADGRLAVDSLERAGADFVKVYSEIPRDAYFAIADEARKQGIVFAGHVPDSVTAVEASDAGQKSIEHLTGVALTFATQETALRAKLKQELTEDFTPDANNETHGRIDAEALDSYSSQKAAKVFARLVKNGTWQCPTLIALRDASLVDESRLTEELKYMPSLMKLWNTNGHIQRQDRNAEDGALQRRRFLRELELVKDMQQAGVEFLAGTDTPTPYGIPGFSLHEELELMVKAGLTPMQALQTATLNPARYLGQQQQLGTIGAGKLADLVLLDANPLEDIRNTQKIHAVMVRGRLLDRKKLDQLLAQAAVAGHRKS